MFVRVALFLLTLVLLSFAPSGKLAAFVSKIDFASTGAADGVKIIVSGALPDTCWSMRGQDVDVSGWQITINVQAERRSGFCFPRTVPYQFEKSLAGLRQGNYTVTVTDPNNSKSASFDIPVPKPPRTVVYTAFFGERRVLLFGEAGARLGNFETEVGGQPPTSLAGFGDTLVAIFGGRYLAKMTPGNGRVLWFVDARVNSSPLFPISDVATTRDFVYVANPGNLGYLLKYHVADGSPVWPSPKEDSESLDGTTFYPSKIAAAGNSLYALYGGRYLAALNPADGRRLWGIDMGGPASATPMDSDIAVTQDAIFMVRPGGYLSKYSLTGLEIWTKSPRVEGNPDLPTVLASTDTSLFAGFGGHFVTGVDPSEGGVLWDKDLGMGQLRLVSIATSIVSSSFSPAGIPSGTDCNGNGQDDSTDIATAVSKDQDRDGFPDECQSGRDCNRNGFDDAFDLMNRISLDGNRNGIPDECESGFFVRGDANSNLRVDLSDAIWVLEFLFVDTGRSVCFYAADVDNNGVLSITDPIYLLYSLFIEDTPLPPPYPTCGRTPDSHDRGCYLRPPC